MEYGILRNVEVKNKRSPIYVPKHKKWIELFRLIQKMGGHDFEYEVVKLKWRKEFEDENYIKENFETLFVRPPHIIYPEPEHNDDDYFGLE